MVDSILPRNTWPTGVVEPTHPGPDRGVRIVKVFRRLVSKIVVVLEKEGYATCAEGRTITDGDLASYTV